MLLGASETQPPTAVRSLQARMLGAGSFSHVPTYLVPSVMVPRNPENTKGEQHFFSRNASTHFLSGGLTSPLDGLIRKGLCCLASGALLTMSGKGDDRDDSACSRPRRPRRVRKTKTS